MIPEAKAFDAALDQAVAETFEAMAFLEVRREAGAAPAAGRQECRWAAVTIETPFRAELLLACCQDLLGEIAQCLHGERAAAEPDAIMSDIVAEMINVIAGRAAGLTAPSGMAVAVSLPRRGRGWPEGLRAEDTVIYALDDGRCFAVVRRLHPV